MNAGMCVEAFTLSVWREDWLDEKYSAFVVVLFPSLSFLFLVSSTFTVVTLFLQKPNTQ